MNAKVTDEQILAYHDRHIAPLMVGVPDEVQERMRTQYVLDVRANPEAMRQFAEMVERGEL